MWPAITSVGPLLGTIRDQIGLLFDVTGAWTWPLVALIAVCFLMTVAGLGASRNQFVAGD